MTTPRSAPAPKKIKIGIQPTGWTNDDFPEIGNDTPYQQILDETALAGFKGGSTGHNYPTHLPSLRHALATRKLGITSTWVGTSFTAPGGFEQTMNYVQEQITFLKAVGATDIVVAELAGAINQVKYKSVLADRPIFNGPQWYLLTEGLNAAGKLAQDNGMRLSFHPHVGTGVEIRPEIDRLMAGTDPKYVSMCLDTGHLYFSGVDPMAVTTAYAKRIGHVHLKNVRGAVADKAVPGLYSFYQAIQDGIFTVPGDPEGAVDLAPILKVLLDHDFEGWLVVEAEQNPAKAPPLACAKMAREYIRNVTGL
jgi:inosose dehydratase